MKNFRDSTTALRAKGVRRFHEASTSVRRAAPLGLVFTPGFLLVLTGVAVLFAPSVLIALIAAVLVGSGVFFCFVVWKLNKLRQRFEQAAKGIQASVIIQQRRAAGQTFEAGADPAKNPAERRAEGAERGSELVGIRSIDSKKIIFH